MSNNLTFSKHIEKTVFTCRKLVGWIMRTFRSRNKDVILVMWNSMIQSRLDYCSQLWSPSLTSEISKLEDVQRNFTKRIEGMHDMSYHERLKALRMYSQERRRDRYMLIIIWTVMNGLVSGYTLEFAGSDGASRGRECVVADIVRTSPAAVRRAQENSLSVKGARMFNLLPPYLRNIS